MSLISLRSVEPARTISSLAGSWPQAAQPIKVPQAVYSEQSFEPLYALVPQFRTEIPGVRLQLGMVENATLVMHPGIDGLILDEFGAAVEETTYHGDIFWKQLKTAEFDVNGPVRHIEDTFVAFDASWTVYYHWLVFCLGSAGVADRLIPSTTSIAIPDWSACSAQRPKGVSETVFNQVERVVDAGRLLRLSDGVYKVRRAYFLYVESGQPSDAALHTSYRDVFKQLRSDKSGGGPARVFVSRGGKGGAARVTTSEEEALAEVMIDYQFDKVRLEKLTFQQQIDLFANADTIVAPHGSGLTNLVFAAPDAKVLELQTEIDAPGMLRPWFYALAAASGLDYAFLNRAAGDLTSGRLREGLAALGVDQPSPALRHWRRARQRIGLAAARFKAGS